MKRFAFALICVLATSGLSDASAGTLGMDYLSIDGTSSGASNTNGWSFTLSDTKTVSGLGVLDVGIVQGDIVGAQVGLWADGGALLASATISSGARVVPTVGSGNSLIANWRFEDINLTLGPGTYVLGATGATLPFATSLFYNPDLTFNGLRRDTSGTFARPDLSASGAGSTANIEFASISAVPLPASALLLIGGLALLSTRARSTKRRQ